MSPAIYLTAWGIVLFLAVLVLCAVIEGWMDK